MNLRKIITRFATDPDDPRELRRVARALGNELPRERPSILRGFRAEISRVRGASSRAGSRAECRADYASGYVACMLDLTAEVEVALRDADDAAETRRAALEEGWRDVLVMLRDGPALPSTIAERLHIDRSSVSRLLSRMRAAGLVETAPGDIIDGRTRPHRMTWSGRRLLHQLDRDLPDDMRLGIQFAVTLMGHLLHNVPSTANELQAVARDMLGNTETAMHAVQAWTEAATQAGLLHNPRRPMNDQQQWRESEQEAAAREAPEVASDAPWQRVPRVMAQVATPGKGNDKPLFVRTTEAAWPAWAFALTQDREHQRSRAIVDGDIRTRSIQPPETPFRLVYDDPAAISADAANPNMRELMARADEKFVVAYPDVELGHIPDDFIPIPMPMAASEGE